LAAALIERLQSRSGIRILDFATGSGRNTDVLRAAGFTVVPIGDAAAALQAPLAGIRGSFDAAISTHGLLHGTPAIVASLLCAVAESLGSGGLLYATFGSIHDARFGLGERIDDRTFAPTDGDERGVAHAYFDRDDVEALLERHFKVESLQEHGVDRVAGGWAHRDRPLRDAVHWFAIGEKL